MDTADELGRRIQALDGKDYGDYQTLKGSWSFPRFAFQMERIPKDPYAPPEAGLFRVVVSRQEAGWDAEWSDTPAKKLALADFLVRRFFRQTETLCPGVRGTGHGGIITIARPGPAFLERSAIQVFAERLEVRIAIGLPAKGRHIAARTAKTMLLEELPAIVDQSLFAERVDPSVLAAHQQALADSWFIRESLVRQGLAAFVADGARLPRFSGEDQTPATGRVIPFQSPPSLRVAMRLPRGQTVTGMAIPQGVTLIVGGGYHGKSTLLQALEMGVYDHIPGDGRENCVALETAAKVRAFDGRSVSGVELSAFIGSLPAGADTGCFSTLNASGSTSQAAFLAESLEAGAKLLLMDEDTCATNFMIRDRRMQALVEREDEPITAFVDRVRQLYQHLGVSTILVMGGSGDYFGEADCVIQMKGFQPLDVTEKAWQIADQLDTGRAREARGELGMPRLRLPLARGLEPENMYGKLSIHASHLKRLVYGNQSVDLTDLEQLVETNQTHTLGWAIRYACRYMDTNTPLNQVVEQVMEDIGKGGLDILTENLSGNLVAFRGVELAGAINRLRGLKVVQQQKKETHPSGEDR
ncbi:MAG: ABC-ATPase domain-containing protein [Deltaproteobacteria bacterium]|nr:ABC-ATPase domain-containing protein [Deltaproteobacteria bacterium]